MPNDSFFFFLWCADIIKTSSVSHYSCEVFKRRKEKKPTRSFKLHDRGPFISLAQTHATLYDMLTWNQENQMWVRSSPNEAWQKKKRSNLASAGLLTPVRLPAAFRDVTSAVSRCPDSLSEMRPIVASGRVTSETAARRSLPLPVYDVLMHNITPLAF